MGKSEFLFKWKDTIFSENILFLFFASKTKGLPFGNPLFNLAEAQRFELWNPFGSPVFKTDYNINNIKELILILGISATFQLF
ncbi:TPA_asm: hypothetical protein G0G79_20610 [Salmonella enterica]|uniref:Uncharacterized protein n=1 Tax=Salmonella enterica TaxID=28901 RepID=A0A403T2V0_SALER|nr:hypothetical protein [Salmonella enterica]HAC8267030.1 hypothetical protein [Salmonella enterica]